MLDFGLTCFMTTETIGPAELAVLAEERGFESLLLPEHTHIPSQRVSPFPGGELPDEYGRIYDPYIGCAFAAAATERLRVGTAVSLIAQHHPIVLAKEIASLDQLSGGRVVLGIGAGWNREEAANHGLDPAQRFAAIGERVAAMRAIWSEETASYAGAESGFEAIWCGPKPRQRPGPPILVGGNGAPAQERALAYGDEWLPICLWEPEQVLTEIPALRSRAEQDGRELGVTAYLAPEDAGTLERFAAAGAHRAVFMVPSAGRDEVEPRLDQLAALREEL